MVIQKLAEDAAIQALERVYDCIENRESFVFEAGAGAGKTYSLIKALNFLINKEGPSLARRHQKIACITFTKVAKQEIDSRTDRNPVLHSSTIHAFCWSLISNFQSELRKELLNIEKWTERLQEAGLENVGSRMITYDLGYPSIEDSYIALYHDDVLALTVKLLEYPKFRSIFVNKYPVLFIDEYQDTNNEFIEAIKTNFLGVEGAPLMGFFGDHWQKIYGDGCGKIDHPSLKVIEKNSNFRSVIDIVNVLNHMRPELEQFVKDPGLNGSAAVYHTNNWAGARQTGAQWKGDLPPHDAHQYLEKLVEKLTLEGWNFEGEVSKILMLTHNVLAEEQGYRNFAGVFKYNDQFIKKEDKHVAFFVDILEPACAAYESKKYGEMFSILGERAIVNSYSDKLEWQKNMDELLNIRSTGTVGQVIDFLLAKQQPRLPEAIVEKNRELRDFVPTPEIEEPAPLSQLRELRKILYKEVMSFANFSNKYTPFATKHSVKGSEFENVLVVIGRGWSKYNFNQMLEWARLGVPRDKQDAFENSRNLFYVAISRPKTRLAILFTQELSSDALKTLEAWFESSNIHALT